MDEQDLERLLFPDEAAKYLGVSVQELARLRRQGRVRGTPLPGHEQLTVYKFADLRKADLTRKRGRPRKKRIS